MGASAYEDYENGYQEEPKYETLNGVIVMMSPCQAFFTLMLALISSIFLKTIYEKSRVKYITTALTFIFRKKIG